MANVLWRKTLGDLQIVAVDGDPNGANTEPQGSIAINSQGKFHQNTDGSTTWVERKGIPHDLGGLEHIADTLANLNSKISDATLDTSSDPRTDDDAIHDNVSGEINAITEKVTPVSADLILIEDSVASNAKKKVQVGNLPGGAGGEANTASSAGIGVSLFYQKSGVDLEFNAIKSENNRVSIALDAISHDVEVTLNEGNIVHQNLSGAGTNTHAQIDTHVGSTSNPHATDVGNLGSGLLSELNIAITDATLDDSGDPRTDNDAIHDNVSGEIFAITEKITPVSADVLVIEDSAAANVKKRVQVGNLPGGAADEKVKISSNDTTADYLLSKLIGTASRITVTEVGDGGDEDLQLDAGANILDTTTAAQINGITEKTVPVIDDWVLIEDSAASNAKKKAKLENLVYQTEYDNGVSGAAKTIDWSANGKWQRITLTANCTLSFTNPPGLCMLRLRIIQNGTGGYTISLPAATLMARANKSVSLVANEESIMVLQYSGSSNYRGMIARKFLTT